MESKFRAGTRVKHPMWGDGIVLDSKLQDEDEIVDVVFESVGIKRTRGKSRKFKGNVIAKGEKNGIRKIW